MLLLPLERLKILIFGQAPRREKSCAMAVVSRNKKQAFRPLRDVLTVLGIGTAIVLQLTVLQGHVQSLFEEGRAWYTAISVIFGLALIGWTVVWPRYHSYRIDKKTKILEEQARASEPGHFKLKPYSDGTEDQDRFHRLDGIHNDVLSWLGQSSAPILYLTGKSGVGKTSLLCAYVMPNINRTCVQLRGIMDPIAALRTQLLSVWKQPPHFRDEEVETILRSAVRYLRDNDRPPLLVVFDQFEELLIIHDHHPSLTKSMLDCLSSLVPNPIEGLTTVLVMRTDYIGKIKNLGLPAIIDGGNWLEIPPFGVPAAIRFLTEGGVEPDVASELVRQGCELEETPGLVTPITLNLLGLIYERSPHEVIRRARAKGSAEGILTQHLRHWISDPLIRDSSSEILREMITSVGTKCPRSIDDLQATTGIESGLVERCLVILQAKGVVRCIDSLTGMWEISHDFVARRIDSILSKTEYKLWTSLRRWLPHTVLVLWLVLFIGLPWLQPWLQRDNWENAFDAAKGEISMRDGKKWAHFESKEAIIRPIARFLSLQNDLYGVDLSELYVAFDRVLPHLRLPTIRVISLRSTSIRDIHLEHIGNNLLSLQELDLRDCGKLTNVDGLKGLASLQELYLSRCDNLPLC